MGVRAEQDKQGERGAGRDPMPLQQIMSYNTQP